MRVGRRCRRKRGHRRRDAVRGAVDRRDLPSRVRRACRPRTGAEGEPRSVTVYRGSAAARRGPPADGEHDWLDRHRDPHLNGIWTLSLVPMRAVRLHPALDIVTRTLHSFGPPSMLAPGTPHSFSTEQCMGPAGIIRFGRTLICSQDPPLLGQSGTVDRSRREPYTWSTLSVTQMEAGLMLRRNWPVSEQGGWKRARRGI